MPVLEIEKVVQSINENGATSEELSQLRTFKEKTLQIAKRLSNTAKDDISKMYVLYSNSNQSHQFEKGYEQRQREIVGDHSAYLDLITHVQTELAK